MTLRFHRGLQVPSLRFVSLVNWTAFNAGRGRISNFARKKSNTEVVHVRRGRRDCTSLPIPAFFARYACHVKGGFCELSASFVHLGGVPGQHRPRSPAMPIKSRMSTEPLESLFSLPPCRKYSSFTRKLSPCGCDVKIGQQCFVGTSTKPKATRHFHSPVVMLGCAECLLGGDWIIKILKR